MFCPNCGQQNPDDGRFCRSCGKEIGTAPAALDKRGVREMNRRRNKEKELTPESAIPQIFSGIAFIVVSIILMTTGAIGGHVWGFWLLIPGFGSLGAGFAKYMKYKRLQEEKQFRALDPIPNEPVQQSLPSAKDFQAPALGDRYRTGDLVPPSVTDNTTRHLDINSEGQTMTLPKK